MTKVIITFIHHFMTSFVLFWCSQFLHHEEPIRYQGSQAKALWSSNLDIASTALDSCHWQWRHCASDMRKHRSSHPEICLMCLCQSLFIHIQPHACNTPYISLLIFCDGLCFWLETLWFQNPNQTTCGDMVAWPEVWVGVFSHTGCKRICPCQSTWKCGIAFWQSHGHINGSSGTCTWRWNWCEGYHGHH